MRPVPREMRAADVHSVTSRTVRVNGLMAEAAGNPVQRPGANKPFSGRYISWQGRQDLNPQPTVLETAALPVELLPCMIADVRLCHAANVILAKAATFVNGGWRCGRTQDRVRSLGRCDPSEGSPRRPGHGLLRTFGDHPSGGYWPGVENIYG